MAQYRALIKGTRGQASRLGSKSSGIVASINGWDVGVRVVGGFEDGKDVFYVYKTGGSHDALLPKLIKKVK